MRYGLFILAQSIITQDQVNLPKGGLTADNVTKILQLVFGAAGAIAFIIIVLSAFRYIVSQGESQSIAKAKNGIINAIIGLVICILGFTIVTFVVGNL